MRDAEDHELADLRWHWGSAYDITVQDGRWQAVRLDGKGEWLIAEDPENLARLIRADYQADPVPRDVE